MADVTYKIILQSRGGGSSSPKSTATTPKGEDVSPKEQETSIYAAYKTIRNSAPVALALKYANTAITTTINRIDLRTGRSTYQQQVQWQYSTALKGASIVGAIVGGLATQNYLLALGGAVSAVDMGIDYAIAAENIKLERSVEGIGIGMANIRAGAGGDRHNRATY